MASIDKNLMNMLIMKKQKEVLTDANKMLIDILSMEENLKPKPTVRISVHSLEKVVNKFKDVDDLHIISESSKKLQVCASIKEY